jgi:hypothetical protein
MQMPYDRCLCGFTELDDETLADHLAVVFTPDDCVGNDGKVHEELSGHACACGFAAASAGDLEGHLMAMFTPADGIGLDGQRHEPRDAG